MTQEEPASDMRAAKAADADRDPRSVPILDRLGTRFAMVLAMALLPIGTVSLYMTAQVQDQIRARTETTLLGETLRAATPEISLVQRSRGLVAGLAGALRDPMPAAACKALLRNAKLTIAEASVVVFVPRSGLMTCSSTGETHDFTDNPIFQSLRDAQRPGFAIIRHAPLSKASVLAISHPVFDQQGAYQGYVSVSLPHSGLEQLNVPPTLPNSPGEGTIHFLTFNRQGEILTASAGVDIADFQRPRDRPLTSLIGQPSSVFRAQSQAGSERSFAVVPLVEGQLYLLSSWAPPGSEQTRLSGLLPYLPPVLMLLVGLIVAGWASERLVTRHVRVLNQAMARFATGDRHLHQNPVRHAPAELTALGRSFCEMGESITRSEAELEDTIHQREVLLREVHHRVKNNLQLMVSIINMQRRRIVTPEARHIVKRLQDRIAGLATIHRGLYQTSGLADVRADELLGDVVHQVVRLAITPEALVSIETEFDPVRITPDQAVPLALFLTEAVGNAVQFVGVPAQGQARITVSLKTQGDGTAVLKVANTLHAESTPSPVPNANPDPAVGLGARLMITFARQIGGTVESGIVQGEHCDTLHFTLRQLSDAEERDNSETAA
jgi:two-component sensor histidine kinase